MPSVRLSVTRREPNLGWCVANRDEAVSKGGLGGGGERRPRSTPASLRRRTVAASTILDQRPPGSLPLDSVFAPRVLGAGEVIRLHVQSRLFRKLGFSKLYDPLSMLLLLIFVLTDCASIRQHAEHNVSLIYQISDKSKNH